MRSSNIYKENELLYYYLPLIPSQEKDESVIDDTTLEGRALQTDDAV